MNATPYSAASCAVSFRTLKPIRLPTNAGISLLTITLRPSRFVSIATTRLTTSGSVSMPGMTSVPTITCGGLNRWTPRKLRRNESLRPRAISVTDSPEEPDATIASGRRLLSISSKKCLLSGRSSASDSKIIAASPTARSRSVSYAPSEIRSAIASARASFCASANPWAALSDLRASSVTLYPAPANTHPAPAPMVPLAPIIATLLLGKRLSGLRGIMVSSSGTHAVELQCARDHPDCRASKRGCSKRCWVSSRLLCGAAPSQPRAARDVSRGRPSVPSSVPRRASSVPLLREKIPGSRFMPYSSRRANQLVGLTWPPASRRILGHRHARAVAPRIQYSLHELPRLLDELRAGEQRMVAVHHIE